MNASVQLDQKFLPSKSRQVHWNWNVGVRSFEADCISNNTSFTTA